MTTMSIMVFSNSSSLAFSLSVSVRAASSIPVTKSVPNSVPYTESKAVLTVPEVAVNKIFTLLS